VVTAPEHGFDYQFPLPAGCLRVLEVKVDGRQIEAFRLEGGKILCDASGPLETICLVDVTEPALWDAAFTGAFALRVAWAIGTKIAGSSFDKDKVWRSYQVSLAGAKRVDAAENPTLERDESDWILARHSPATWDPRT
jgi:hypothetical protein